MESQVYYLNGDTFTLPGPPCIRKAEDGRCHGAWWDLYTSIGGEDRFPCAHDFLQATKGYVSGSRSVADIESRGLCADGRPSPGLRSLDVIDMAGDELEECDACGATVPIRSMWCVRGMAVCAGCQPVEARGLGASAG